MVTNGLTLGNRKASAATRATEASGCVGLAIRRARSHDQILLIIGGYGEGAIIGASNLVRTNGQRAADENIFQRSRVKGD
jgi:hypothetical protein